MSLHLGQRIAPPRFVLFLVVAIAGTVGASGWLGLAEGTMAGFDLGALVFLGACWPLLDDRPREMRAAAVRNDANRAVLLAVTAGVVGVILVAIFAELRDKHAPDMASTALIVGTLALAWLFSNFVYALHYAHLFYMPDEGEGGDRGGIAVPETDEPTYWDFVYFAFTLGMTFQTSDVEIRSTRIRRVVVAHCLAAFVFNIGVLAFSINVLGGGQ